MNLLYKTSRLENAMLWDTHLHCCFSGDSETDPEDTIRSAVKKGLSGICFTDHEDIDYPGDPDLFLLDFDSYRSRIHALREQYQHILPIHFGMELGLQPHLADKHTALLDSETFDFVIGSSHLVHGKDPYYPEYYAGRTEDEGYQEYFSSILENIQAFDGFDVYGHIDYVVRYGPHKNEFYSYKQYSDIIDEILKLLIEKGKGIEINTGGFRHGLGHPNPTEDIIRRYRELGGEIITIGSDAHKPEHVAFDFEKVPGILTDCGFKYFTVFKERKPQFLSLT